MKTKQYIEEIQKQYQSGIAREHTYRPALQQFLAEVFPDLIVVNEPARMACGAPDFILQRKTDNIPIAYIEAKDINDPDLSGCNKNKEQFTRYKQSLDNIIFTDYLNFLLYEKGEFVDNVRIAELKGEKIIFIEKNEEKFRHLISRFGNARPQKITSSVKLAEIMASKARLLAEVIEKSLSIGDKEGNLEGQMNAFKEVLIHDITPKEFADIYSQTIAYGMFAARLHDSTTDTFSRHEAAMLIPKTNPFLRQLFQNVAGYDLDERINWIVDDLAETFKTTDIQAVMKGFGKRTQQTDSMIHFYENFLSAYDPKLKKSRGVWYTPQAVVNFIVYAVDQILQTEFKLPMGLADTSKITVERSVIQSLDKRYIDHKKKEKIDLHRVQILDPATGTGTFLAEIVNQIYSKFQGQNGMWQGYVEEHLLPRLNGFELLMASYTMAHLKLDLLLTETGYKAINNKRLRVYLTNSLEEFHEDSGTLFAQFLAREANGANEIKRNSPVMVVLGNPPYSVSSSNKGKWITDLLSEYKEGLNERNIQPLSDDYIKFIRYGQHFISKNGEGILAYISNNSFIDGLIHRQMRKSLLNTFDKIYILDLHGNSKKKETSPDGGKDKNVFDIMQGVSINIFIKTGQKSKNELGEVYHYDLYGKREDKYHFLLNNNLSSIEWHKLSFQDDNYFFVPKDFELKEEYEKGFKIDELFHSGSVGISTSKDSVNIWNTPEEVKHMLNDLNNLPEEEFRIRYNVGADSRDWSIARAKSDIGTHIDEDKIIPISYRPFDTKFLYYTGLTNGIVARPRFRSLGCMLSHRNLGLIVPRQTTQNWRHVFISQKIIDGNFTSSARLLGAGQLFPLYTNGGRAAKKIFDDPIPNLDTNIVKKISTAIGLEFETEKSNGTGKFSPIDLLDYIYAVLHIPSYREKYKEFLKIDFPRIPYPKNDKQFFQLVSTGSELRTLHLMEHPLLSKLITQYDIPGNNSVEHIRWEFLENSQYGRIWINEKQYFNNVPTIAWDFYIGGYQPAQKWLKDRRGCTLSYDDTRYYQQIIKVLYLTHDIMQSINE